MCLFVIFTLSHPQPILTRTEHPSPISLTLQSTKTITFFFHIAEAIDLIQFKASEGNSIQLNSNEFIPRVFVCEASKLLPKFLHYPKKLIIIHPLQKNNEIIKIIMCENSSIKKLKKTSAYCSSCRSSYILIKSIHISDTFGHQIY